MAQSLVKPHLSQRLQPLSSVDETNNIFVQETRRAYGAISGGKCRGVIDIPTCQGQQSPQPVPNVPQGLSDCVIIHQQGWAEGSKCQGRRAQYNRSDNQQLPRCQCL